MIYLPALLDGGAAGSNGSWGLDVACVYSIQCNPALYLIFTTTGEAQREAVRAAQQCLKPLEAALEGRRFFGGDAVGYLDIVVGWLAHWLPVISGGPSFWSRLGPKFSGKKSAAKNTAYMT